MTIHATCTHVQRLGAMFSGINSSQVSYQPIVIIKIINCTRSFDCCVGKFWRLLTGTRRHDHISPVLSRLHWLPIKQRVVFKLAILVFKSLCGETPSYLADDCELIADSGRRCDRLTPTLSLFRELTLGSETGVCL